MSKKKVKFHSLDADPHQFAVVVNYTTDIQQFDEVDGTLIGVESTPGQKVVRLPRDMQGNDIRRVAQEVVEKCKYIPSSRAADVERVIAALVEYEDNARAEQQMQQAPPPTMHQQNPTSPPRERPPPQAQDRQASRRPPSKPLLPDANIRFVEDYADQLYEDKMELKVHGAKCILRCCMEPVNLEILAEHDTLLGVLSRELRESSKKSADLSIAIVCTFLCFSHFSQFHGVLMQHQCGDVTMRVVEYECQRHQVRIADLEQRRRRLQEMSEAVPPEEKKQLLKDEKKFKLQLSKQSKLLTVCLSVLLNLAEEIPIERKMVNRKIPQLLSGLADREHEELLGITLTFLKKLSVFEENKEKISTQPTLTRLVQLANHPNVAIALRVLRLMYNLSFDEQVRGQLCESGMIKLLVDKMRDAPFRHIVIRLLYNFSMDERKSNMAYYPDGMVMLLQLVVHFPEPRVGKDLVALVVNLSTHPRAAEIMVKSGLFPQVMMRVLKYRDPLLCKVIRHVSSHPSVLELMMDLLQSDSVRMSKWMHEFVRTALCCIDTPDLLLEVLGTLANVTLPDVPWWELCEAGLIELLTRLLVPSFSEDDIVLECVMITSNIALSRDSAQHIAGSRLPGMLQDLLIERREDEEIVVQLLFTFECLLLYDEVRDYVLQDTDLGPCVMRFARARNPMVLERASKLLQLVAEYCADAVDSPSWVEQIKMFRFEQHNLEWCTYVHKEMSGSGGSPMGYGDYYDDQEGSCEEEDEPEFAFHWHGQHAMDAQDLADRDWGNKDVEAFMRTSRFVS